VPSVLPGLIPAFVLIVLPFFYNYDETTAVFALELVAAGLLLARSLGLTGEDRAGDSPGHDERRFWLLTLVWVVFIGVSVVTSENSSASFPVFLKLLAVLMLAWLTARDTGKPAWALSMAFSAGLAGWFHGTIAIQEYADAAPMPLTWADPALRAVIRTRCAGMFTDPNVFGAFLAALIPWQIFGLRQFGAEKAPEPNRHSSFIRIFFGGGLLLTGTALMMTFSRGAYLAVIAGLVMAFAIWRPALRQPLNTPRRMFVLILILFAVLFCIGPFKYRFISIGNTKDMTFAQRTLINKGIFAAAAQVPWTGYGLHTFSQVYPRFRCVGGDYPLNAHNEFLQTFLEAGPFATGLLALMALCLWWAARNKWASGLRSWPGGAAAGSWAVFFLHSLSGFSDRMLPTAAFFALAVGSTIVDITSYSTGPIPGNPVPALPPETKPNLPAAAVLLLYLALGTGEIRHQLDLDAASAELASGQIRTAAARLAGLATARPSDPIVWALAARSAEAQHDTGKALDCLTRAAALNPNEALFWSERARIIETASGTAGALPLLRHAIELDPASEQFRLDMAKMLLSLGRPREALTELDAALRTSPGFHEVYRTYLQVEELRNTLLETIASSPSTGALPAVENPQETVRGASDEP